MSNFLKKITKRSFVIPLTAIMFTFSVAGCETLRSWWPWSGDEETSSPAPTEAPTEAPQNPVE